MNKYQNLPYVVVANPENYPSPEDVVCAQPMTKITSLIFTYTFNWNWGNDSSTYCSCNNQNKKHITQNSFEYDYCTNCKKEIK